MKDSNKISIKIKCQSLDDRLNEVEQAEMVTEWHVKRILGALILLLSIILLLVYFFTRETVEKKIENTVEIESIKESVSNTEIEQIIPTIKQDNGIKKTKLNPPRSKILDARVIRALLAKGINNKEPSGKIKTSLLVTKESAAGIYYFTEIVDMEGQTLYHQWMWNKRMIYRRKIKIWGNRWRAATSKLIPYSRAGTWQVRLTDKEGVVLSEAEFDVVKDQ